MERGSKPDLEVNNDGLCWFKDRLCVPNNPDIRKVILEEAHASRYTIHPGSTKMYHDLRLHYWWNNIKKEITVFVSKCLVCQQIKAEHKKPAGLFL